MNRCERILSEGQACFRTGRITEEQIEKWNERALNYLVVLASLIIISPTVERCAPANKQDVKKARKLSRVFTLDCKT